MPPRPRPVSPSSSEPSAVRQKQHEFADGFADDGDLILRSSDGISFVVTRLPLSFASDVFENMLAIPQPAHTEPRPAGKEGLDIVDLEEKADVLSITLRFVYKEKLSCSYPDLADPSHLAQTLSFFKKYEMEILLNLVGRSYIPQVHRTYLHHSFPLAVIYGHLDIARNLLRQFEDHPVVDAESKMWSRKQRAEVGGRRPISIGDFPTEYIQEMPALAIKSFAVVHTKVLSCRHSDYTWKDASREFSF